MSIPATSTAMNTAQIILNKAIPLFASSGYAGVSMRDIANEVGISGAALYHHYPDKQSLYVAAMEHAFTDKAAGIASALDSSGTATDRLERFVTSFTELMASDPNFRALLQRELLDGDEERLRLLASQVFEKPFQAMTQLAEELAPDCDAHMLAISMAGLILFHFESAPVRQFLPGGLQGHDQPEVIAQHVIRLLTRAVGH